MEKLQRESESCYMDRNRRQKGINWQFSLDDARIRLKHFLTCAELN